MIDVETLKHNVTSAREGLLLARLSRLFRHVAMAILEHGPGGYLCVVLLAPNLRLVDLPAEELTHPESFHTTYSHHRAAPCGSHEPVSTDGRCANHGLLPSSSLNPDPSLTGIPGTSPSKERARQCTVLCGPCCTQTTGSQPPPSSAPTPPTHQQKTPSWHQGRWEDSQPRP